MIDNEKKVFDFVAGKLRENFENIYVVGDEIVSAPKSLPAVVVRKSSSMTNTKYSTFADIETVVKETYYCTIYSNAETGKTAQCKEIASIVNDSFAELRYKRVYEEQLFNADATIGRRVLKFTADNVV